MVGAGLKPGTPFIPKVSTRHASQEKWIAIRPMPEFFLQFDFFERPSPIRSHSHFFSRSTTRHSRLYQAVWFTFAMIFCLVFPTLLILLCSFAAPLSNVLVCQLSPFEGCEFSPVLRSLLRIDRFRDESPIDSSPFSLFPCLDARRNFFGGPGCMLSLDSGLTQTFSAVRL